jgi:hypothetical protein
VKTELSNTEITFIAEPKYVGSWCIGGNWYVMLTKKPTDEQIKNTEQLLGWIWNENRK